jgi:pimeloyl-ACP methyl ester carboxylesterase
VLVYLLVCGLYYAYQHLLYFQPKSLNANHIFTFPVRLKFATLKIPFDENTQIDVVKFRADAQYQKPKGVVLFFHGNRFNVEHYSTYAPYFTGHGYEVWMPDYPGYGRSTGEIEMEVLDDLAVQLYKLARTQFAPGEIVVYGKSLGTGVASFLASQRDCRHLILETPYYSLSSLTQAYAYFLPIPNLIRFNLKTGAYFKEVGAPITVLTAAKDELIPLSNSLRLLTAMKKGDAFYIVDKAGHNGLPLQKQYHDIIDSIFQR